MSKPKIDKKAWLYKSISAFFDKGEYESAVSVNERRWRWKCGNEEFKLYLPHLRKFVKALNDLPDEIRNNQVDMQNTVPPSCGSPGCHAGLISLLPMPDLKKLYGNSCYNYDLWANTLANYLSNHASFNDIRRVMERYFDDNPEVWGKDNGRFIFTRGWAFGQDGDTFPHSIIIDHWNDVLKRVEEQELNK